MKLDYKDFRSFADLETFVADLAMENILTIETLKWSDNSEAYRVWYFKSLKEG